MKKIIFIFTLLSVFFVWNCSDPIIEDEWSSSARVWEDKLGDYRGTIEIAVDGLPMDTVVQQGLFSGDNYNQVTLWIAKLSILDKHYGNIFFRELSFKESGGVIYIKGKNNFMVGTGSSPQLVTFEISGEIKNDVLMFDITINGLESLELQLTMRNGRRVDKLPSELSSVEKFIVEEEDKVNRPFITGNTSISYGNAYDYLRFFVADSLTITDSTYFAVKPRLELAQGAWIEPDANMNWTVTHNFDIEDAPSIATTDSLYRFSESKSDFMQEQRYEIKVWAADSINSTNYLVSYVQSNAIKISLFNWKLGTSGAFNEPIAGWATNNAYIETLAASNVELSKIYTERVLGANIGDTGAKVRTAVLGTVTDANIEVISGKLFRGVFDMDSIDTPKKGELHGVVFSKRKPVTISGQYKYFPGEVLYVGDSIVPDSVLNHTDSCYIEAFLYESPTSDVYLDSLDYMKDVKVIGHAKFVGGESYSFRNFTMHFDVRNWIPERRYHLGIVCRSSGKSEQRIGAPGSELTVSGFELMSTKVL